MGSRNRTLSRSWRWPLAAGAAAALTAAAFGAGQLAFAGTSFDDNFEDGNSNGWSKSGGTWSVVTDGSRALRQSKAGTDNARVFAGDNGSVNYAARVRVKPLSLGSGGYVGLLARAKSSTSFYRLALLAGNRAELQAINSGAVTVLGSASRGVSVGTWYTLSLKVNGSTISGAVDGATIATVTDSRLAGGRIGLQTSLSTASFDDVTMGDSDAGTPGPTTAPPTTRPPVTQPPTTRPPTTRPPTTQPPTPPTGQPPTGNWPKPSGQAPVKNGTIKVPRELDGKMQRFCCIGDGGQGESQDAVFELAPGAVIKNVILGAPAGDGIHCEGDCTIQNVWWEDVGEDGATFRGGANYYVIGGGARSATDKLFQHNGGGTVHISGFYAENVGKLYRACGNCASSFQRHVVMDNVMVRSTKILAGINSNFGDTARFSRITVFGSATICQKFKGVPKGSEPPKLGDDADGVNCVYRESDITRR
jgi:hypothetical protein